MIQGWLEIEKRILYGTLTNGTFCLTEKPQGKKVVQVARCSIERLSDTSFAVRFPSSQQKLICHTASSDNWCTPLPQMYLKSRKQVHLILIRHGHYVNATKPGATDREKVLSELGKQQAELTGLYLQDFFCQGTREETIEVQSSDLTRASETAETIAQKISGGRFQTDSLFREGWPGQPFPGGNSKHSEEDDGRMQLACDFLFHHQVDDPDWIYRVIVCHANIIRYFICQALGISAKGVWGLFEINHCSITRIDLYEDRSRKIVAVNETGHLPETLKTSSQDHL